MHRFARWFINLKIRIMFKIYTFSVLIDGIKKRISFYETNQKDADKRLKIILEDNKNIKLEL